MLSDAKRLYDIATRLQIYTEGVKIHQAKEFGKVAKKVSDNLERTLRRIRYRTLDGLTKAQLNKLLISLRDSQMRIYNEYTQTLIEQLRAFMDVSLQVNQSVWVTARIETEGDDDLFVSPANAIAYLKNNVEPNTNALYGIAAITGNNDRLWSQITNSPIPANGLYLLPFVKMFAVSAQSGVENIIRKGWANRQSVEEIITELVGSPDVVQGTSSQVVRQSNQAAAIQNTVISHIAAFTMAAVSSALFPQYAWYSVMDGKTSMTCRHRNGKVYRYGHGPIPPAHINCRSHIAPVAFGEVADEETLYTWMGRQPAVVRNDSLLSALSIEQFLMRISRIVSR